MWADTTCLLSAQILLVCAIGLSTFSVSAEPFDGICLVNPNYAGHNQTGKAFLPSTIIPLVGRDPGSFVWDWGVTPKAEPCLLVCRGGQDLGAFRVVCGHRLGLVREQCG